MTILIGGEHGVVHFGPRSNPTLDKYWAERGLIHHELTTTGEYQKLTVRDFLERLKGVNDMLGNSTATDAKENFAHQDEIERQKRFVEEGIELVKQAQNQGMPSDPKARAELKRRQPVSVVVPGRNPKYSF